MDAVTCRDRHWYDVIFGILLIASGITYAIFDVATYGIGASTILTIPLMIILCIVGIDFIGSHFFRQITVSEEEVIYRNALGRETRLPWEQVEVDYKPRGPKREERFLFMTGA